LGRALANHPPVLLMDEPLSSLDEETRDRMIELLQGLPNRADVTVLHVSHSRIEADRLGDIVFRVENGRVETIKSATKLPPVENVTEQRPHGPA
jgi:ABC-type molybdate transport system ATPase subunit